MSGENVVETTVQAPTWNQEAFDETVERMLAERQRQEEHVSLAERAADDWPAWCAWRERQDSLASAEVTRSMRTDAMALLLWLDHLTQSAAFRAELHHPDFYGEIERSYEQLVQRKLPEHLLHPIGVEAMVRHARAYGDGTRSAGFAAFRDGYAAGKAAR